MRRALVIGATGLLGRRVVNSLSASDDIEVIADVADDSTGDRTDRFDGLLVDVVVDVGSSDHDRRASRRESATEFSSAMLEVADRVGAEHVVFVSSAMVYGAASNNPVPLTEDAVLRPDVDFVFARQLATAEELVDEWRRVTSGRKTCVLRPALALSDGGGSRLAGAVVSGFGHRFALDDPPAQFLHLDDLSSAVQLAVSDRLDGVYNVAPDGWVAGERVRALSGERPRLPLPERVSEVIGRVRWRLQRGPIPPGLRSYTREPWVIANGRLRAAGWSPTVTNEQAYVEGTEAPWWTVVTPKRRQELALGAGLVLGFSVLAAIVAVSRRWRRHR